MRKLTLIRHGLTSWNTSGKFQGHTDLPLSPEGEAQARALQKRLASLNAQPEAVYSSPLRRALQTAQIALPDADIITDERLKELHFGVFEGYTQAENEQHAAWDTWFANPFKNAAPSGESYEALRQRCVAWLDELPEHRSTIAFAHSGTIQMLVSHVLGVEQPKWRKRIFLRHTGLSVFLFRGNEIVVERVNDARHLEDDVNPFED